MTSYIEDASLTAPAKINLALHVTRRREDGYHLIDSLVAFSDYGDSVLVSNNTKPGAAPLTLEVYGKRAEGVPADPTNLVWQAAELMRAPDDPPIKILLGKLLPHAAGIGGGSSDAAATLLAMARLFGRPLPSKNQVLTLGADVPVCLERRTSRMRGIGEVVEPAPPLPRIWAVLVNPAVEIPTKAVFERLAPKERDPLPALPERWESPGHLFEWLRETRNDLQEPARRVNRKVRDALLFFTGRTNAQFSRMSGSGATCFGLFDDPDAARYAAEKLEDSIYWVRLVRLR